MNCLDCHTRRVDRVALAICRRCGAGVCAEHADVLEHHLETVGGFLVIPQRSEHRARQVLCLACHEAEQELVPPRHTRRTRRVPIAPVGT
ncbi:MAG: DUF2180 family protein [Acidimicrobiia bacterium]